MTVIGGPQAAASEGRVNAEVRATTESDTCALDATAAAELAPAATLPSAYDRAYDMYGVEAAATFSDSCGLDVMAVDSAATDVSASEGTVP